MKYILVLILIYSSQLNAQNSIYDQVVQSSSGTTISLSDFKGSKILIAAISSDNLQKKGAINYWDSLQVSNPKVVFILLPSTDLSTNSDTSQIITSLNANSSKVTLTVWVSAKKDNGSKQYPLLQWLTDVGQNSHFNSDVSSENQIYVINESGVLYAVLESGVSAKVLDDVIKQSFKQ